jgi:two-component system, sensor histidine kinase YesM
MGDNTDPLAQKLALMPSVVAASARGKTSRWLRQLLRLRFPGLSIRAKILLAMAIVIGLMSAPYLFLVAPVLQYKQQYDAIIDNITTATSINGTVKSSIDSKTWSVVIGSTPFSASKLYETIDDVDGRVVRMMANTDSQRGKLKLDVIRRTLQTLRTYVNQLGAQMVSGLTFDEDMPLVEKIRDVTTLVEENMQDYALFEVNRTEPQYRALQSSLATWSLLGVSMVLAAILFSVAATWLISQSISRPIKQLQDVTRTITHRDLQALVSADNADEIAELGRNFNIMVGQIRELLDAKMLEHEQLQKAELRVLQAQINPHFLYNTLDAIVWMAEANRPAQVVDLVRELSRFFRITLSKGKDWITLREEIGHVESYLAIQKMRYRDILDYHIDVGADLLDVSILKLTLQPLVENALYHGIKNKRSGGTITLRAQPTGDGSLFIEIEDNGIGMRPEKLQLLRAQLHSANDPGTGPESGFGLNNVNQRLHLYYGEKYGLTIESEYKVGTRVSLVIPLDRAEDGALSLSTRTET